MESTTVTTPVQKAEAPWVSITVSVMLLAPTFAHDKFVWLKLIDAMPQSSYEPLSIITGIMLTVPDAFK